VRPGKGAMKRLLSFRVNGDPVQVAVRPASPLLHVLRNELGLTGTKEGCGSGDCGTCTVLLDGEAVNACLLLALEVEGRSVETIELWPMGRFSVASVRPEPS